MSNPKPRPLRNRSKHGRGQSLVEFALVFPIFILLLSGMIDFGFGFYSYMTVINGARVGARVASINPIDTNGAIENAVTNEAVALSSAPTTTFQCLPSGSSTWQSCTAAGYTPTKGDFVRVTVTYTYGAVMPLPFLSRIPMTSTVQMAIEAAST